jgi:DNA polymerase IV
LAHRIFSASLPLLKREATGAAFRLIGVGISNLSTEVIETKSLDARVETLTRAERAIDKLRGKFGRHAVERGLGFKSEND